MKSSRLFFITSVLFLAAAVCGCKDDDDETSLYMNGSLRLPIDKYVEAGYSKTFNVDTLINVTLQDGTTDGIGYAYTLPLVATRDTIKTKEGGFTKKTFTAVAPDSLSTFSFFLVAFADGYYESSVYAYMTVVKPGINGEKTTLTGYDIKDTDPVFKDERDGREYYYSEKGGLQWMRQNLAWQGAGLSYQSCSCPGVSTVFGRYYTWEEAQDVCPEGWRLPSDKDWCALSAACGVEAKEGSDIKGFAGKIMENIYFNGSRMWEYWRDVKIDNEAGLSAAPFGYAFYKDDAFEFKGYGEYASFWTSDQTEDLGVYRYIIGDKNVVYYGAADKTSFAASVRCVREVPTL